MDNDGKLHLPETSNLSVEDIVDEVMDQQGEVSSV
jgi:hypothetical protein